MRKRGKKRIPQEVKPWFGVKEFSPEILTLPSKKTAHWVSGGRRDWNTKILNLGNKHEITRLACKAIENNNSSSEDFKYKLFIKQFTTFRKNSVSRYKNFCLISGRGRTYNRKLYFARHNLRKLVGIGVVSGLIK